MQSWVRKGAVMFAGTLCLSATGIGIANLASANGAAPAKSTSHTAEVAPTKVHDVVEGVDDEIANNQDAADSQENQNETVVDVAPVKVGADQGDDHANDDQSDAESGHDSADDANDDQSDSESGHDSADDANDDQSDSESGHDSNDDSNDD